MYVFMKECMHRLLREYHVKASSEYDVKASSRVRCGWLTLSFILSGRPPTLWWDLMVADGPLYEIDSITSGYSVPYGSIHRQAAERDDGSGEGQRLGEGRTQLRT